MLPVPHGTRFRCLLICLLVVRDDVKQSPRDSPGIGRTVNIAGVRHGLILGRYNTEVVTNRCVLYILRRMAMVRQRRLYRRTDIMTAIRARTRACNKQREAGRGSPGSGQRKTDELRPDASPASQAKVTPEGAKQTHKAIYIGKRRPVTRRKTSTPLRGAQHRTSSSACPWCPRPSRKKLQPHSPHHAKGRPWLAWRRTRGALLCGSRGVGDGGRRCR